MQLKRLAPLGAAVVLAGCGGNGGGGGSTEQDAVAGCRSVVAHVHENGGFPNKEVELDPAKTYRLTFVTNCGEFTITLDQKRSPITAGSFFSLARRGFFNDTFFHRIVPGFVIQGGDPTGSGSGGPGYETVEPPPKQFRYAHGVVAMAKGGAEPAGTAGSQFFVVTGDDAGLPSDYAVLGKVTKGLDVVDRIGKLGDVNEQPTQAVVISKVRIQVS